MPTWEELVTRAGKLISSLLDAHEKAPQFGAYNKLIGKKSNGKRDVIQSCIANLKLVNEVSQMLYQQDVVSFDDEVNVPKMSVNVNKK